MTQWGRIEGCDFSGSKIVHNTTTEVVHKCSSYSCHFSVPFSLRFGHLHIIELAEHLVCGLCMFPRQK